MVIKKNPKNKRVFLSILKTIAAALLNRSSLMCIMQAHGADSKIQSKNLKSNAQTAGFFYTNSR